MKALIDGDIVVHRVGYTTDNEPFGIARARTDEMIEKILEDIHADHYQIWLSDSYENNFRKHLDESYKANRTLPRPVHYQALKDYLFESWSANLALGMEADDAMGIEQCNQDGTIICSIDKDLLQIPGEHYNFVKEEHKFVTEHDGMVHFYVQLVMGDRSDNIGGFDGVMRQSLPKFLEPVKNNLICCMNEWDMYSIVRELYNNDDRLHKNGRLMWIRRMDDEVWTPPVQNMKNSQQEVVESPKSESGTMVEKDPSSVPTGLEKNGFPALGSPQGDSMKKDLQA